MKTKIIMAAATIAGALLIKYLMNKKNEELSDFQETAPVKRSHHLTDVFAHAKNHSE